MARRAPRNPRQVMEALHRVDPTDGDTIAAILESARENRVVMDLSPDAESKRSPDERAWLLAWCSDADGCEFYAIPESALDDNRRADLLAVRGACFAGGDDLAVGPLGAAIRLIAGLTSVGNRDSAELADELWNGWSHEFEGAEVEAGIAGAADLERHLGWLQPYFVRSMADVRRSFGRVVAVNRAM